MIEHLSRKIVMMWVIKIVMMWALFLVCVISVSAGAESEGEDGNSGVSAMQLALLPNNKIIFFDSTDFGSSNFPLPFGKCRIHQFLKKDCWNRSIEYMEYDFHTNQVSSFQLQTETWCSSGAMAPDGCLIQTCGFNEGDGTVRVFSPSHFCDCTEIPNRRWHGTHHILPGAKIMVVGGRGQFNSQFDPKKQSQSVYQFPFLQKSMDWEENNIIYPLVHLGPDGNLFIFANGKSILFDHVNKRVVRHYPDMPAYSSNSYVQTSASSVLLPLDPGASDAEVLICGAGAAEFSYREVIRSNSTTNTCGRLRFTDPDPHWRMESMPMRPTVMVMGDMLLLPTGDVLIINGASKGSGSGDTILYGLLYKPSSPGPLRFEVLTPPATRRLYRPSCHMLPDGRVLVGGNNLDKFRGVPHSTDLSLEAFSPPYLAPENDAHRPLITSWPSSMGYGRTFTMRFYLQILAGQQKEAISVTILAPSNFTTHSYSMSQRLLGLEIIEVVQIFEVIYETTVTVPRNAALAPPGFYLLFLVHAGIPSPGKWIKITCDEPRSIESMSIKEPMPMEAVSEEALCMETCMSDEGVCTEAATSNGLTTTMAPAVAGMALGLCFCLLWVKRICEYLISTGRTRMTPQETAVALAAPLTVLLLLDLLCSLL